MDALLQCVLRHWQKTQCPRTHCVKAPMCPLSAPQIAWHKQIMQRHQLTRSGIPNLHVPAPS